MNNLLRVSRSELFTLALPIILLVAIIMSWSSGSQPDTIAHDTKPEWQSSRPIEIQTYTLQWKIALGGLEYLNQTQAEFGHEEMALAFRSQALSSLKKGLHSAAKKHPDNPLFTRRILALASYLQFADLHNKLHARLSEHAKSNSEYVDIDRLLLKATDPFRQSDPLTANEYRTLEQALPWFAAIAASSAEKDSAQARKYREQFSLTSISFFKKFIVGAACGVVIALLSFIATLYYILRFFRKGFTTRFHLQGMKSSFCLEIFCIYLALMLIVPNCLKDLVDMSETASVLRVNVIAMLSLILLILWPTAFGVSRSEVASTLGLDLNKNLKVIREVLVGISFYLAALIPFFVILVAYQFLLQALDVDPAKGAHPVIPILTNSPDSSAAIWIILLAVVIAPVIEEIMFRGAFYRWLRGRVSPMWAVVISSLVFASVHPQGIIGLLPLSFIGGLAAILREWRQSLIASMTLHACFNAATLFIVLTFLT